MLSQARRRDLPARQDSAGAASGCVRPLLVLEEGRCQSCRSCERGAGERRLPAFAEAAARFSATRKRTMALRTDTQRYLRDELQGERLVVGELYRALRPLVARQRLLKRSRPAGRGVKADVVLERREVHEVALQVEGRHLVAEALHSLRRGGANGGAQGLQPLLHLDGERRNAPA